MIQFAALASLLLALAALWPAMGGAITRAQSGAEPVRVLATTTQVQDFVRNVGGDRVTVIPVLNGDDDAHVYQPTAADARSVADAAVIFTNGVGLEPWFDRLAQNARPGVPIVKLAEVSSVPLLPGDRDNPVGNPHVWFDPTNVQRMVNTIRDTLTTVDPAGQDVYAANAVAYNAQLDQLDADIKALWAPVPESQRKLVTNHDAFPYYVNRYGLTFVGSIIPSLSTEAEPSASETQRLIQAIRTQRVRSIFTESSLSSRLAQQISQQAGVRIYSNLYGDALGRPGTPGDTYIKMMRFNTETMIDGMTR